MRVVINVSSLSTSVSSSTVIEKHRGLSLLVANVLVIEIGAKSPLEPTSVRDKELSHKLAQYDRVFSYLLFLSLFLLCAMVAAIK